MSKKLELYAIWETDNAQHFYGGKVSDMDEQGRVECEESYGKGWWTPFKLLPLAKGLAFMENLQELAWQLRKDQDKLRHEYNLKVIKLLDNSQILDKQERKGLYYSWVKKIEGTKSEREF